MSFTGSNIKNVRSQFFVDLLGSNFTPGTAIVIFTLNQAPSGTVNQQWRITPVPASKNLFIIQNVLTGLYVGIDGIAGVGQPIISDVTAMPWEINAIDDPFSHNVTIKVPHTNFFWNAGSNDALTQITLAKGDGSTGQQWIPLSSLPAA